MANSERAWKKVGTIEIKSGYVVASDPCYTYGIWCAAEIKVKNGLYDVLISEFDTGWEWGTIISSILIVLHGKKIKELDLNAIDATLGVDAGVCGFFDRDYYKETHSTDSMEDGEWYEREVMDTINYRFHISKDGAGDCVGVHAHSGYGDGEYSLYGAEEDGEYYALMIDFLGNSDEE